MTLPTTIATDKTEYTISSYGIFAPMIELRWQSANLGLNHSHGNGSGYLSDVAGTSPGLSAGAKAGIAIGVLVIFLAAFLGGIFLFRRQTDFNQGHCTSRSATVAVCLPKVYNM